MNDMVDAIVKNVEKIAGIIKVLKIKANLVAVRAIQASLYEVVFFLVCLSH